MKLEIDFTNKTIEVKDNATLGEVVEKLKQMNLEWKEFTIQAHQTWTYYPTHPLIPSWPVITWGNTYALASQ